MPDIVKKKKEVKDQILDGPKNVIAARTEVLENVQLGEEMKTALCWAVTSNNLPYWSEQLAKQRAILQGKTFAASGIIKFTFANSTFSGNTTVPGWGSQAATITLPKLEDSSNTSFGVQSFWSEDDTIEVTLSGTSGSTQTINGYSYSTYVGDYFFTRSRKDGSIIDIDANNKPYTSPTIMEPLVPADTVNGLTYFGTANTPTANTEYRYDYTLLTNATSHGHAGGGKDIGETKYTGNTFVNLTMVEVDGEFTSDEILKDSDGATSNVKSYTNTTTVDVDLEFVNGTFTLGETVTIGTTNATINTLSATTNTENSIGANSFLTGSNTSYDNGFEVSNTITLGSEAIVRIGPIASVSFANGHGVVAGDRVVITGAEAGFEEFDGTFDVIDSNTTHFSYETSNSTSITPVGNFKFIKGLAVGLTSNASGAIVSRTMNNSATVLIQNINAASNTSDDAGFAINNVVTGNTSSATAKIQNRVKDGNWVASYTDNVKTYDVVNGSWDYDSANNPGGMPAEANTGDFWLKENEAVNIASYTAATSTDGSDVNKIILTKPIATASDTSGGYDSDERTFLPKLYGKLPIKSRADQTSGTTTFLEAYANFATVIVVSEGLEKNADWLALGNNVSGNTSGADLTIAGGVGNSAHSTENTTTANVSTWLGELGPYSKDKSGGDDIIKSSNPEYRSSGANSSYANTSTADTMYKGIEKNPFYPSVGATHKAYSNTDNDSRGTQPYGYGEDDIYAGQFFQFEKGRKFEDDTGASDPAHIWDDYSYRYGIWADQKWALGVDPELTVTLPVSTGTGAPGSGPTSTQGGTGRKGPPSNRFKETFTSSVSTLTALSDAGPSFNSGTGGTFTLNGSTTSGTYPLTVPAATWPTSPHTFETTHTVSGSYSSSAPDANSVWANIGCVSDAKTRVVYLLLDAFTVPAANISGSGTAVQYPKIVVSRTYTAGAVSVGASPAVSPQTYTHTYSWSAGACTYFTCTYN